MDQKKVRRDLAMAAEVQRRWLRPHAPRSAAATFAAFTLPARTIGGDYYDFRDLEAEQVEWNPALRGKSCVATLAVCVCPSTCPSLVRMSVRVPLESGYNRPGYLIMHTPENDDPTFSDAVEGLHRGDFSRLEMHFDEQSGRSGEPRIVEWHHQGRFRDQPKALAEALTCASFLGRTRVAEYLVTHGVDPSGGAGTGLDALHWAANRGQLEAVRLLIRAKAPLETRSRYGGTALGTAIWSAINEPRGDQLQIIQELIDAGASLENAVYPTGHKHIDEILQRHGSR